MNCACPEVGAVFAWRRAGYKREQFAQHCPEANFLREELVVPNCRETGRSLASSFRPCEIPFAPKLVRTPPNAAAAVRSYLSGQATRREHGAPATVSSRLLISALEKRPLYLCPVRTADELPPLQPPDRAPGHRRTLASLTYGTCATVMKGVDSVAFGVPKKILLVGSFTLHRVREKWREVPLRQFPVDC